jgi:Zn finger protein HypA/HybF involved in hydrogenase expression
MKKMGISDIRETFRSFSNPQAGYSPLKYFCMNCGNEHREISCPKCGSKMKRVG